MGNNVYVVVLGESKQSKQNERTFTNKKKHFFFAFILTIKVLIQNHGEPFYFFI